MPLAVLVVSHVLDILVAALWGTVASWVDDVVAMPMAAFEVYRPAVEKEFKETSIHICFAFQMSL